MSKGILQDISRMASSAFSGAVGVKREVNAAVRSQIEEFIRGMNFVRREEFEALQKMVVADRKKIDELLADKHKKADVVAAKNTGIKKKAIYSAKVKKIKQVPINR